MLLIHWFIYHSQTYPIDVLPKFLRAASEDKQIKQIKQPTTAKYKVKQYVVYSCYMLLQ